MKKSLSILVFVLFILNTAIAIHKDYEYPGLSKGFLIHETFHLKDKSTLYFLRNKNNKKFVFNKVDQNFRNPISSAVLKNSKTFSNKSQPNSFVFANQAFVLYKNKGAKIILESFSLTTLESIKKITIVQSIGKINPSFYTSVKNGKLAVLIGYYTPETGAMEKLLVFNKNLEITNTVENEIPDGKNSYRSNDKSYLFSSTGIMYKLVYKYSAESNKRSYNLRNVNQNNNSTIYGVSDMIQAQLREHPTTNKVHVFGYKTTIKEFLKSDNKQGYLSGGKWIIGGEISGFYSIFLEGEKQSKSFSKVSRIYSCSEIADIHYFGSENFTFITYQNSPSDQRKRAEIKCFIFKKNDLSKSFLIDRSQYIGEAMKGQKNVFEIIKPKTFFKNGALHIFYSVTTDIGLKLPKGAVEPVSLNKRNLGFTHTYINMSNKKRKDIRLVSEYASIYDLIMPYYGSKKDNTTLIFRRWGGKRAKAGAFIEIKF